MGLKGIKGEPGNDGPDGPMGDRVSGIFIRFTTTSKLMSSRKFQL